MSASTSTAVPAARPNPSSPGSSRKVAKASASSSAPSSRSRPVDPFYGHEETALLCARFISSLFQCPNIPAATHAGAPTPSLAHFVAYALHRTRLPSVVTFAALLLLQRLKTRFPAARGSSGHRLFISAFMIASKVICDDTYSNQSWCIVGQKMFQLKEINQMEREMCGYLEWNLNVSGEDVAEFEALVRADHGARPAMRMSANIPEPASSMASIPHSVAAAAYPSPEATPNGIGARPIRPVPTPSYKRSHTAFPSPASSTRNPYLNVSPQPPALASASSSLASSPASEDCKTPSPVAMVSKPKRPSSMRTHSSKSVSDFDHGFASNVRAAMQAGGQPLSVGVW
ncbi:hypothetical protein CcaverHIS002_0204260 [Cutaneotrichosporon cavernicola]|uniref:Cyclin N-terminal domain-containing protein n=1 Tax=Cutaneotrichosporon cavernicola TaxID=279322 RepID=A0AA48KZV9_9TREE|nr:uncharacterized protein CcaverHIS019_0204230 [Cutaneotrichosporon cavernicola]BEI81266.1 hypothetical protein CcaverHIS002_0204260 [Cutaneotrichosporon cavernicola]BEI89061.1 hypothetical protein CcaverHIS019_0204230 [Cutaneotrichosporon cavernicola]